MKPQNYTVEIKMKGTKKFEKKCNRVASALDKVNDAIARTTNSLKVYEKNIGKDRTLGR